MGSPLATDNPTIVGAFHAALRHQAVVVAVVALTAIAIGNLVRMRTTPAGPGATAAAAAAGPEPAARRLLRLGFGALWVLDGILQAQAAMPLGMIPQVVQPAASTSPAWVRHLVDSAATVWTYHPVTAAAAAVWIQVGIGLWMIVAPRGDWSRVAGVVGAGWGLVVWVFGNAFGGVFGSGLTWMLGAPGAVIVYSAAGLLVALPDRWWAGTRPGRVLVLGTGAFFAGMALLQAWPGRGTWQGSGLHDMLVTMAQTPQPGVLSSAISALARLVAAHGGAVNLLVVGVLASVAAGLLSGRRTPLRAGVALGVVACLADWVFVQDLGFLGGVGTDPNSMVPLVLVLLACALALDGARRGAIADVSPIVEHRPGGRRLDRLTTAGPVHAFRAVAALGAVVVTLVGVAPMTLAATRTAADPILTVAVDGPPQPEDTPAPDFVLTDQAGHPVSLPSLRGRVVALTFLDPVCTSDCPVIAQELRQAARMLGGAAGAGGDVELVAIDANPRYLAPAYLRAFDAQEHLDGPGWAYLTGSLPQLRRVWASYGIQVEEAPAGAMVAHNDLVFVIDAAGRVRYQLDSDPGPATDATSSSFAAVLAGALHSALAQR